MEVTVFATLANELLMHIKHYKQLNKNELWKTVSRTSFQKQNFSRFYNNLLQVCSSAPSFVYAVLYIPSFTVDRLFLFPHTDKISWYSSVTAKSHERSVTKSGHTGELRSDNKRIMSTFLTICVTQNACLKLWKGVAL